MACHEFMPVLNMTW